jgi:hypothetical protein
MAHTYKGEDAFSHGKYASFHTGYDSLAACGRPRRRLAPREEIIVNAPQDRYGKSRTEVYEGICIKASAWYMSNY